MPLPRHISNSWLCVTWLKLGNSKTEGLPLIAITLNVAIHVRTYPLPITSVAHFRLVPRTEWWLLWFIAGHRGRPGQGFLYRITVDRIGVSGPLASQGCDRFLRGAEATVIGAVGGREIIGMRRFAGEE